jgi:hypothetical protein
MRLSASAILLIALGGCNTTLRIADGTWTAECANVQLADCKGVAELFVNNLARSSETVRVASGGVVRVALAPRCPGDTPDWADPNACWRAIAPMATGRACMIIARQREPPGGPSRFGQVGGDNYTGIFNAPDPGSAPC